MTYPGKPGVNPKTKRTSLEESFDIHLASV
jgi:hypothetical protein